MIKIPLDWRLWLGTQPEYGMGYQHGRVKLASGSWQLGYIFNGATFATSAEVATLPPIELARAEAAASMSSITVTQVSLIARPAESLKGVRRISAALLNRMQKSGDYIALSAANSVNQGAKDAPVTETLAGELFKRFSAYVDDFKITAKRGLKPGTFATTDADAMNVLTGRDAISRYALENKQSANKRFTISPLAKTRLQQGIVQPAYGEVGGGVEVIFVDGTADGSVSQPDILPE
ncbi:MAG: hypothetical protein K1Y02_25405 [Candidatus Hydrogenedentes bacterium]|nr:hypothetical protein [Candidatus Hydrogenedentota bacterium]